LRRNAKSGRRNARPADESDALQRGQWLERALDTLEPEVEPGWATIGCALRTVNAIAWASPS
jgi:hypothetical protein